MEDKFPLIDKFIQGKLDDNETSTFEKATQDADFRKEIEFRKQVHAASKIVGRQNLKKQLSSIKETPVRKMKTIMLWRSVAAVGIMLIAAYFLLKPTQNLIQSDQLYSAHYEPLENKLVVISRGAQDDFDSLKLAMTAYNAKNYEEALELIELIEYKNPNIHIYKGSIAMEQQNYDKAISIFSSIAKNTNHKFKTEAQYYLAFCYLKTNLEDKAKTTFLSLASEDSYYGNSAKKILSEWKN